MKSLNDSTTKLNDSSNILNEWIEQEKNLSTAVKNLIESLKEIEELRIKTGGFFDDIKQNMNEGVDVIKRGNSQLMDNVSQLDESFNDRMNQSFRSLDKILQAMVLEYAERVKEN